MASLPSAMNTLAAPCRHFPEFNFMEKHPPSFYIFGFALYSSTKATFSDKIPLKQAEHDVDTMTMTPTTKNINICNSRTVLSSRNLFSANRFGFLI